MRTVGILGFLAALAVCALPGRGQGVVDDSELVETRTEVPKLAPAAPYAMKDGVVEVELSEYAGYAGLIVANGGLDASENSVFFRKHGFKVKLTLSEEESWSSLNAGRLAASATTVDVLAVYGRQFQVQVPALIGFSRGADGIVVRSGIKRINDLRGKVLASCQFTEADFFLRYLADEASIPVNMLPDLKAAPDKGSVNVVYCADGFASGDLFLKDLAAGRDRLAGCVTWAPKTDEVVEASEGKARLLVTNRNLLIVADILAVNRGFADGSPEIVKGLVAGLLEGNALVRTEPDKHLPVIAKAFGWDLADAREELSKVHLANFPENQAFFAGTIDSAGSYNGIYESAVMAYGSALVPNPTASEKFFAKRYLSEIGESGAFKDQKASIQPEKSRGGGVVEGEPLLTKDIRFLFEANSAELDPGDPDIDEKLSTIRKMLQISPGSIVLLRGHVDNSKVEDFRRQGGDGYVRKQAMRAIELSKQRAMTVARRLTEQLGVDPERIEAIGRGWEEPLGSDAEQNRRVEVQWFTLE
ncbi:MAG: phosphate ABC transporter substrate-binding/OmpA family protein [Planctomycetes bacterium]|jgi:NitT/TauT family transport system substrate-binding protein|nr:phosphate ABC transporter substrate-binding/OmpA family protein [Planctomycetota bacterium]